MKDQKELLKKCLINEIPAIVFQGTDACALEILQAAEAIYRKHGCSPEFLQDFHENVVCDFQAYRLENEIKLPDLTPSEKEAFNLLKEKEYASFPEEIKDFESRLNENGFSRSSDGQLFHGQYILINHEDHMGIIAKNGDYEFAINHNKENSLTSFYIFSLDPAYPERHLHYPEFRACFSHIQLEHPLGKEKIPFLNEQIFRFQSLGYKNLAETLFQYASSLEQSNRKFAFVSYRLNDVSIHSSGTKNLTGTVFCQKENASYKFTLTDATMTDRLTGMSGKLHLANIDLLSQNSESLNKLLSGRMTTFVDSAGKEELFSLSKTSTGWSITKAKESISDKDNSVSI